jgi:hypothetical protein
MKHSDLDSSDEPQLVDCVWKTREDDRTEEAGEAVFDPEVEALLNREEPLLTQTAFADKDTHEIMREGMEFTRSQAAGAVFAATVADKGNSWTGDAETNECPECGDEFEEGTGIDGDDGTPFCSLNCLNSHANS